jgi:hypothetical protein
MPPELVIVHDLGVLPMGHCPLGTADDVSIQHWTAKPLSATFCQGWPFVIGAH